MSVSNKYQRSLDRYLEWERVTTPASGTFQETRISAPEIGISTIGGLSAADALCQWESTGKPSQVCSTEQTLLARYLLGKRQRDWWSKEIGWWNKYASFVPEEFLNHLCPLPFIELFGRGPCPQLVRYYFDNGYAAWEFRLDTFMLSKQFDWQMNYYDRDWRDSALKNAWRMLMVKWISPRIYSFGLWWRRGGAQ